MAGRRDARDLCIYMAGIISNEFPSLMKGFPVWPVPLIGSFAGAAEDVDLSPSAVAKLITRLEQRLAVRLIKASQGFYRLLAMEIPVASEN
jgi:DNA-binding Lrp family transcriptional regulator